MAPLCAKPLVVTKIQTCPKCEKACSLQIDYQGSTLFSVVGHKCHQGVVFAETLLGPALKTVSASVLVNGGAYPMVAVRTSKGVTSEQALKIIQEAGRLKVDAPVRMGQVLCRNVAQTGVDLIAARAVELH